MVFWMPKISVIIPAYNQAEYLPIAIQSVLQQTFQDWELIVVDDGSTDVTKDVMAQIKDQRVRYVYQENKGLPGARNTGIGHSSGKYLSFLDADDYYHPDKLAIQANHLDQNTEVGLSYASRISVDQKGDPLRLHRAACEVSLKDFFEGFPFTINDLLVRRSWVESINGFDETFALHSEDRDFYLRLALQGCLFARVAKVLSYRRVHLDRAFKNLPAKLDAMFRALETAFSDPRCTPEVLALRDGAYGRDYLVWGYQAAFQGETALANFYFNEAMRLNPALLENDGIRLVRFIVHAAIADGGEHEEKIKNVINQIPMDKRWIKHSQDWAIAYGYLMRGARDVFWGRSENGRRYFQKATGQREGIDDEFLRYWSEQILNYGMEYGPKRAMIVLLDLDHHLREIGEYWHSRTMKAYFYLNQAFQSYKSGEYSKVPRQAFLAINNNPKHLMNRGVMSITLRSILKNLE